MAQGSDDGDKDERKPPRGPRPWRGKESLTWGIFKAPTRIGDFIVPPTVTRTVVGDLGDPDLRMEFAVRDGRPECTEIHIVAKDDGRAIRDTDLASIRIAPSVTMAFAQAAGRISSQSSGEFTTVFPAVRSENEAHELLGRVEGAAKRKPGSPRAELERVAQVYLESPGKGLKALQNHLGYSARTAARRAKEARAAGLIPDEENT